MRKADLERALKKVEGGALKRIVVSVGGNLYDITTVQYDLGLVVIHVEENPPLVEDHEPDAVA